jgi:hypothetical protein
MISFNHKRFEMVISQLQSSGIIKRWKMICFSLLLCSMNADAQNSPGNQVRLSLTRMLWMPEPGIEMSYQHQASNNFAWQVALGRLMNVLGSPFDHMRGYSLAIEPKFFFAKKPGMAKYLSINLRHTDFQFDKVQTGKDASGNMVTDSFTIRKNAQALSLRVGKEGYIKCFGKPFVIDFSVGAGIRYRQISHSGRSLPYTYSKREILDAPSYEEMKGFAFILPLNLSIGYIF